MEAAGQETRRAECNEMTETIYVALLDEGVPVWRPTQGAPLGDGLYEVLATPDYDDDDEHWEFPPGSIVRCVREMRESVELLIAREAVDPSE